MRCIAIDFETATPKRLSVCAIGLAIVEGGEIIKKFGSLIKPPKIIRDTPIKRPEIIITIGKSPEFYFHPINIMIHGITEMDVEDKPEFNEIWDKYKKYFQDSPIIAHNASFDISVLRNVLDEYNLPYPKIDYYCTRLIAKYTWPNLYNYSLEKVTDHLGIKFKHHHAKSDAVACAEIAIRACQELDVNSLEGIAEKLDIIKGELFHKGHKACRKKGSSKKWKISEIVPTTGEINPDNHFFGKNIVFTGELQSMPRKVAMQKVVNSGGHCVNSVSKKTNYLILGEFDYRKFREGEKSNKLKKAESLIEDGFELEILPESEFLEMLEG